MAQISTISPKDIGNYRVVHKLRKSGRGNTVEIVLPLMFIKKEAEKHKLTIDEFVNQYNGEFSFNGTEGMVLRFVERRQK